MANKVSPLNANYRKKGRPKSGPARSHALFVRCVIAGVAIVTLGCGLSIYNHHQQVATLKQQTKVATTKLTKAKATSASLSAEMKLVNTKGYLEKLARQRYYYSKRGETIYSLPSDKSQGSIGN